MSDWATKVLEGVPRLDTDPLDYTALIPTQGGSLVSYDAALAAIAKMGEGDGLVAELEMSARIWATAADHENAPTFSRGDCRVWAERFTKAAAHIAALTVERRTLRLVIDANIEKHRSRAETAEAEAAALRAKVARLEGALTEIADMPDYRLPKPQDVARAAVTNVPRE